MSQNINHVGDNNQIYIGTECGYKIYFNKDKKDFCCYIRNTRLCHRTYDGIVDLVLNQKIVQSTRLSLVGKSLYSAPYGIVKLQSINGLHCEVVDRTGQTRTIFARWLNVIDDHDVDLIEQVYDQHQKACREKVNITNKCLKNSSFDYILKKAIHENSRASRS